MTAAHPPAEASIDAPARAAAKSRWGLRSALRAALVLFVGGLLVYMGTSVYVADKLSHPKRRAIQLTCADYGPTCREVRFTSAVDDVPLEGWFIDAPGTTAILQLHGRNGARDDFAEVTRELVREGYDVLTFDFRAHGESGGERYSLGPLETRDVEGALAYLKEQGATEVGVIAYSMGAATALLAAPDHPEIEALVVDSPFADLPSVLERELPRNSGLPSIFNPGIIVAGQVAFGIDLTINRPVEAVRRLNDRPILLIHGAEDALIPVSHAYSLRDAAGGNPNFEMWVVPGVGHVKAYGSTPTEYLERVTSFFDTHLK